MLRVSLIFFLFILSTNFSNCFAAQSIYKLDREYNYGYVVQISGKGSYLDDFEVPDTRETPVNCFIVDKLFKQKDLPADKKVEATLEDFQEFKENINCVMEKPICDDLNLMSAVPNREDLEMKFPVYNLFDWDMFFPSELKINANWYDVYGFSGQPIKSFPYIVPCTDVIGTVVSDGEFLSYPNHPDYKNNKNHFLDAFILTTEKERRYKTASIVSNKELQKIIKEEKVKVNSAVSGFMVVKNGVVKTEIPVSAKSDQKIARSFIGIDYDDNIVIAIFRPERISKDQYKQKNGSKSLDEFITFLKNKFRVKDLLNLDNSGSSQFFFKHKFTLYTVGPGDFNTVDQRPAYRSIPNFLSYKSGRFKAFSVDENLELNSIK